MKYLGKLVVLGTAIAASVPFASAAPVPVFGTVATAGGSTVSSTPVFTATTTTFALSGPLSSLTFVTPPPATGNLATLLGAPATDVVTYFNFSSAGIISAGAAGQEIISIAAPGDTLSFFATGFNTIVPSTASTEGTVNLTGYLTESNSAVYLSPQTGVILDFAANGINNNFTEDLVSNTPEPNSLILLGTGLVGAAGMFLRKRQTA